MSINTKKKIVGIIGGMGPGATALLFQKLIDYTDAENDAEHIHIVIDNNTAIPDRTAAILNGENTPAISICESGRKLERFGAELILIPCNTSHFFYDEIQSGLQVPVVNMLAETAKVCMENGWSKVGVLATTGTCRTNIYEKELQKVGIQAIYPDKDGQERVMEIIYDQVKAGKTINASVIDETLKKMSDEGAQAFILGCTELPFAIQQGYLGYEFVDSLDVLAKRAVVLAGYSLKGNEGEVKC